ncbi:enoyl-CoA hydratase/isomerase family protein [Nocardia abscessus]|uniref:enoyl-CoA hydratase/isomerase family protein n=1 Tax=Nocardia TaxID=1817 RepID=UPI001894038A|nr:enoyl-CoA hydratase/isomerase family protein [Nocardia abscessus]MBF6472509.1 enoyl-CoA hydratase/isomerase family protein [Nocardia abscessus]
MGEKTRGWKTILVERAEDGVATVTLNRPESLNAFNQQMREEFSAVWAELNADDDVRAVVIQAAEGRAFSTGVDVKQGLVHPDNIWAKRDPGEMLGPKSNKVWKPVICAVHGMAAGGAFYWITESDIVICSEDATFFDPHVSYGMVASVEPIGLSYRVGPSQALRMALMGLDERVTARTALQIGLVTEVVPLADLRARAHEIAATIAAKPTSAVQGTVRAIWESLDLGRSAALERGLAYATIGSPDGIRTVDRSTYAKPQPRMR